MTSTLVDVQHGAAGGIASSRARTAADIAVVLALVACVVAISAHAPSTTYAYAQTQQIGAVVGTVQSGNWLLPRDHLGGLARKPQLYAWLDAPVLILSGRYSDFTFRAPTVAASFVAAVLVYLLGRRWYGRRAGLISACLWISIHHMAKMMYVAITDMLLTAFIIGALMCADRLLFHRAAPRRRRAWAVGLWACMILGALSKGWGVLNLVLVGFTLALAVALWPGFKALKLARGPARIALAGRLVLRRWRRAAKATHLLLGVLAVAAVLTPLSWGMFARGGQEFRDIVRYEFLARTTGSGEGVPHSSSVPAVLHLLYYMLPVTVFAFAAVLLCGRRTLGRHSPLIIPLCWIVAVVLPFSLTHGFRHDYLLPCYAGGALMGGWAVEQLLRRRELAADGKANRLESLVRHLLAAGALAICALLVVVPLGLLLHDHMPRWVTKNLELPSIVAPQTSAVFFGLIILGAIGVALTIWTSLTWRIRALTAVSVVGMLGVMFIERHAVMRHANTGDGERLMRFGRGAAEIVGDDEFAIARGAKLGTELYIGRFGLDVIDEANLNRVLTEWPAPADAAAQARRAWAAVTMLRDSRLPWLVTSDKSLVELGGTEVDTDGPYQVRADGRSRRFAPRPQWLGEVVLQTDQPIRSQRWGRVYLIRLDRGKLQQWLDGGLYGQAMETEFHSGKQDWEW